MVAESFAASFPVELASAFGGVASAREKVLPGQLADRLLERLREVLANLDLKDLDPETKAFILATIETTYNNVIRPLDIPYVPDVVEPKVDDFVLYLVLMVAKQILGVSE